MTAESKVVETLLCELLESTLHQFPGRRRALEVPKAAGVYVIHDPNGAVLHVGRTPRGVGGLRQRLKNHLHNASSFTRRFLEGRGDQLRNGYSFRYIAVENPRLRALLEAYAIGCLCPAHLGLGDKPGVGAA
jgi:excinuclease UvrABC nuclease subunit